MTVYDYESLYPNCIITYNLSPDTFLESLEGYRGKKEDITTVTITRGEKNIFSNDYNPDPSMADTYHFVK